MAYIKNVWQDGETIATAERMNHIEDGIADLYNAIFPIGQIVIKGDNEDYSNWLGFTWERTAVGKVLVGIDSTDADFNTIVVTDNLFLFLKKYNINVISLDKDTLTNKTLNDVKSLISDGKISYIFARKDEVLDETVNSLINDSFDRKYL